MSGEWIDALARSLGRAGTRRQALRTLAGAVGAAGVAASVERSGAQSCRGEGQGCSGSVPCCDRFKCQTGANPNAGVCVKVEPPPDNGGGGASGGGKKQIAITLDCRSKPQEITITNGGTKGLTLLSISTIKGSKTYTVKDADRRLAPNASITFEAGLTAQKHPISRDSIFAKKKDGVIVTTKEFGDLKKTC